MNPKAETNCESREVPQSQFLMAGHASTSVQECAERDLRAGSGSPWVPLGGPTAQAVHHSEGCVPAGTQDSELAPGKTLHLHLVSFSPIYKAEV